ncbi:5'-nucleotidase C-terminal domain-containing protein, partial [Nonomuraea sp. NPDC001023]|uniref:5'-nucleotidase C-terminal domain-containing protein n=1 Tax=Nonomuraea sp. NPDC001023 TaxID=3154770 RepID=UPI0033168D96
RLIAALAMYWYLSGRRGQAVQPARRLLDVLGVSQGLTYTYDNARPACDRIDPASIKLNGVVVDPAAKYRLTANSFIATGGDGFSVLTEGTERVEKVRDIEAFESYIRARSPLPAPALNRVTRVN